MLRVGTRPIPKTRKKKHTTVHSSVRLKEHNFSRVTFLPPPHCDGVLWIHAHGHQQLASRAEVNVVDPFGVEATQHRNRLLAHGIPDVNGGSRTCVHKDALKEN